LTTTTLSLPPHLVETGESMPVGHLRPEFIYVKVLKESPASKLGISLRHRADHVFISRVQTGGILGRGDSKALVRPGDRVLAINGVSCIRFTAAKVAKLIRNAKSAVSLVVWNKDGDPNLVSCTVQKHQLDSKVGVCIKNDHGAVRVSRVHPDGLFAGSLLLPGHRCIQINGIRTDGFRSRDAASMISLCTDFVTIVSRPRQESAMVLSCEVQSDWWKSVCSRIVPARAVRAVASQSMHV
jgi:predicted metalloprotease with PDZ domain